MLHPPKRLVGMTDASPETLAMRDGNHTEPVLSGKSLTIPAKFNNMPGQERALARGMADSAALWMRHHNEKLHKILMPSSPEARQAFQAAERARVQSLGILQMPGMEENITAEVVNTIKTKNLDIINPPVDKDEKIPLPEIMAMLVRECVAGLKPPPEAEGIMQKWGYLIQARSARHLVKLGRLAQNQEAFAKEINAIIEELQALGSPIEEPEEEQSNEDDSQQKEQNKPHNNAEDDGDAMPVSLDGTESKGGEMEMSKSQQTMPANKEEMKPDFRNIPDDSYDDKKRKKR